MSLKNEFVTSVASYQLHTIWEESSFQINIICLEDDRAWKGKMTSHDFNELTAISDKETYFHNCKEALTQVDQNPAMTYSIDNGFFVWKTLADEGIFIKLGSVKVEHADYVEIMKKILLVAINKSKQLQSEKAKWVLKEKELYSALEEAAKQKNKIEEELYSRFLPILNAKKKKISELQEQCKCSLKK